MASGHNSRLECLSYRLKVLIHTLAAVHFHLFKYMVVTAAHKDSRLTNTEITNELKVLLRCSDPSGYLGKTKSEILTSCHSLSVFLTVNEELSLTNDTVRTAQSGHKLKEIDYLLNCVGVYGLLTISERGIGDPYLLRHIHRHATMVERHLRHRLIIIYISVKIGLFYVLKLISILFLLQ